MNNEKFSLYLQESITRALFASFPYNRRICTACLRMQSLFCLHSSSTWLLMSTSADRDKRSFIRVFFFHEQRYLKQ